MKFLSTLAALLFSCLFVFGQTLPDCNNVHIWVSNDSLLVSGLKSAPVANIQVFDINWESIVNKNFNNPPDTLFVSRLTLGQYFVNVRLYDNSWASICEKGGQVSVKVGKPIPIMMGDLIVNENVGIARISVCQNMPREEYVSFPYTVRSGTASSGSDYSTVSGTIEFQPGQMCASIDVPIINDTLREPNEYFTVSIYNLNAKVTITDDDEPQVNCDGLNMSADNNSITLSGITAPISTVQVFNSNWATVFSQTYTSSPGTVNVPIGLGNYSVKVTFYSSNWTYVCDRSQNITVANQCPPGTVCVSNTCPSQTVDLNTAYSISNLPPGTTISWHTGTTATDSNKITNTEAQNVGASGTYYAAINITGARCYSQTIPVNVTIIQCSTSSAVNAIQLKSETSPATRSIMVFPNPFTRSVRVVIDSEKRERAVLIVTDLVGRTLKNIPVQLVPGSNSFLIDGLDKYPSGNYFLTVNSTSERKTIKLMRQQ